MQMATPLSNNDYAYQTAGMVLLGGRHTLSSAILMLDLAISAAAAIVLLGFLPTSPPSQFLRLYSHCRP
jgi:hypothetical protein